MTGTTMRTRVSWVYFGGIAVAALAFVVVVVITMVSPLDGTSATTPGEAFLAFALAALGVLVAYWRFVWPHVQLTDSELRTWSIGLKPRVVSRTDLASVNVDRALGMGSVVVVLKSGERVSLEGLGIGWGESRLREWQDLQAQKIASWADVSVETSAA